MLFRWVRDEFAASEVETAKRLGINSYDVLTKIAERVTCRDRKDFCSIRTFRANAPLYGIRMPVVPFWLNPPPSERAYDPCCPGRGYFQPRTRYCSPWKNRLGNLPPFKLQVGLHVLLWRQMMSDIFNQEVVVPESLRKFLSGCRRAWFVRYRADPIASCRFFHGGYNASTYPC